MPSLNKNHLDILWDIVKQYDFSMFKLANKDFRADIDFLIKNEFIENYFNAFRLLPDGVIYLCIETEFFDISRWTHLVRERRKNKNETMYSSYYETDEYNMICNKIANIKAERDRIILNNISNFINSGDYLCPY